MTTKTKQVVADEILRKSVELKYKNQLEYLHSIDDGDKPYEWYLSPKMLMKFVIGASNSDNFDIDIDQKFYGDKRLVERAIVTLASDRGLLLIGEPGTGKSWLAELLAAGICQNSTYVVQGTSATTEEQIKYSWNIAAVIAKGQSRETIIPSPIFTAMEQGKIGRMEELTRCTSDVQDSLISIMSEKYISIPELDEENVVYAKNGFNIIATANSRDKGVNEISSALKRRFNFVTIPIVNDPKIEREIVEFRVSDLIEKKGLDNKVPKNILEIILETFADLREANNSLNDESAKLESALSTAEQISILEEAILQARFFHGTARVTALAQSLIGSLARRLPEDLTMLNNFWHSAIKQKSSKTKSWKRFYADGQAAMKMFR